MAETLTVAALGLGGNIGDPKQSMRRALQALDAEEHCRLLAVSALYVTPPWGKTDQADFFNCCALLETALAAPELLDLCLAIEHRLKRVRGERWGPRTIDIDLLTYGGLSIATERLTLPHPRMTDRAFVTVPLCDVAPDLMVDGKPVAAWAQIADRTGMRRVSDGSDWWR